ncbi:heterokaryon incompatibility protein-domain-containing protein [Xylaria telfairii]|nr:heterokaryon incompatibility protein-domain-containing protein [Xylaria telfairii]
MTSLVYGLANWAWIGKEHGTKAGIKVYEQTVQVAQKYRDHRTRKAARTSPIVHVSPPSHLPTYNYRPLLQRSSIRILVIEPGPSESPLRCSLEEVSLDLHPSFAALSYCWGDASNTYAIEISDCYVAITKNLYESLMRMRHQDRKLCLWVDALSINQGDLDERKQQVGLMDRIYTQADTCIVWLGDHTETDACAFKLLETIAQYLCSEGVDEDRGKPLLPGRLAGKFCTTLGEWKALNQLFHKPWFERVWTLQEIVLAKSARITCGIFSIDAHVFYQIVQFLDRSSFARRWIHLEGGYLQSLRVATLRRRFQTGLVNADIFELLQNARDRNSSDPRDKVIGMFGLCPSARDALSGVGYDLSAEDIYTMVATHVLQSRNPFRIFAACSPTAKSQFVTTLPCWVPDWSYRVPAIPCLQEYEQRELYSAGGANTAKISISGRNLTIKGRIVSSLDVFVDRHSNTLIQEFNDKYYPKLSLAERLGRWYFNIAIGWIFDCWDEEESKRPVKTIDQFFLEKCWSMLSRRDTAVFKETMLAALTNTRAKDGVGFQDSIISYAQGLHQHEAANTAQSAFLENINSWTQVRKFCVTGGGYVGWVPLEAQPDDVICLFEGSALPYVLRPKDQDEGIYGMVGHCFLHGVMFGEIVNQRNWKDILLQ